MFFLFNCLSFAWVDVFNNVPGIFNPAYNGTPPSKFTYKWVEDTNGFTWRPGPIGDFDIEYSIPGYPSQTTFAYNGWWVRVGVDDQLDFLKGADGKNGTLIKNNVLFTTNLSQPIGPDYVLIQFNVTNNDNVPHKVKISSYTDIQIAYNDFASVYPIFGPNKQVRGLNMSDNTPSNGRQPSGLSLILIVRDGYGVRNVDTFWYGHYIINYEFQLNFWTNLLNYASLLNTDSAFTFGWNNTDIYPKQTITFGVLLGLAKDIHNPPVVTITNEPTINNLPNTKVEINVKVSDDDPDKDNITLYWEYINESNVKVSNSIPNLVAYYGNPTTVTFYVPIGATQVRKYPLTIYAIDRYGLKSNLINIDLLANQVPRLTILDSLKPKYYTGGIVEVLGRVWDDSTAQITYQFDDGFYYQADQPLNCNGNELSFRKTFPLKNINYGEHTLKIWATDEFGIKSQEYTYKFTYAELHAPVITLYNTTNSMPNYYYNNFTQIKGCVSDQDIGDTVTLEYLPPDADALDSFIQFATVVADGTCINFTLNLLIPPNPTPGLKKITIRAKDQNDAVSPYAYYNYTLVHLPTNPIASPTPFPSVAPHDPNSPVTNSNTNTYTETITSDKNGNPTKTWIITMTSIMINTDAVPTPTPEVNAAVQGVIKKNDKNKSIWLIIGIAAGVAALVALIAIIIIVHEARKPPAEFNAEDVENLGENGATFENDNPIYNQDAQDDPFANEFEDPGQDPQGFT